ncbi:conserved hypothetical protein [Agrobacterium genomosp. 13 str. CFBP 6927]|uniref:Uncharacterized protein n=1 Tax=Agrobacterium genomosp. 13 str. CFBP 6927 TaxID=1183428 RepID=A0ABM9VM48_9HYPH|nr:conserved hypothetical protein [Agrobacterium genomosp. 13 str. CFBP 6927]
MRRVYLQENRAIRLESEQCSLMSQDRIKAEHREIHFADLFPFEFEITFFLPEAPGMIQRMKVALLILARSPPRQTKQIKSKRMKSLRHVRLLWSAPLSSGERRKWSIFSIKLLFYNWRIADKCGLRLWRREKFRS